jgi:hypothetical protein
MLFSSCVALSVRLSLSEAEWNARQHDGSFLMYYTAESAANPGFHCVSAATASSPQGPFQPLAAALVCDIA